MTSNINLYASVAIFFRLNIDPSIQKEIFKAEGVGTSIVEPPKEIAPGISVGPTEIAITETDEAKVEYNADRYLLRIESNLNNIYEVNKKVASIFEKHYYPFSKVVRYCEFNFPGQPFEIPDLANKIGPKIKVTNFDVGAIFGMGLKPYSISFSYPESPLNDYWMHVQFMPYSNSPNNRMILSITKRTQTHDEMLEFLMDIKDKIMEIRGLFEKE